MQNEYNIQKIISSDLNRATQTADIINTELNLPIEYTERLREMNNSIHRVVINNENRFIDIENFKEHLSEKISDF